MSEKNLMRANKVTINPNGDGFKADFYRTHKHLITVNSADIEFEMPEGTTKSGARELFRTFVIENAESYGIEWNPQDMRSAGNIRKANYHTDEELIDDAESMLLSQIKPLVDDCKYPVEFRGISHEDICPVEQTASGASLANMGITDGKYNRSGNWAWARLGFTITATYKGNEIYVPIKMDLVSGQLKKPKMGITMMNEAIKTEIIESGLATADELDPPKENKKPKKSEDTPVVEESQPIEETKVEEVPTEDKPKRRRRKKSEDAE